MQQVAKIAAAQIVNSDAMIFVDSDIAFVRPFEAKHVLGDGRVRLHRVPGAANQPSHQRWHRQAALLLGIEPSDYFGSDYIAPLACWHKQTVLKMCQHIEEAQHRDWRRVLCNTLHLSEYILYGVFAEHILGIEKAGHYSDDRDLCHNCWSYAKIGQELDFDKFLSEIQPHHVAVLVQSNLGIDPSQYAEHIRQLEARLAAHAEPVNSNA